MHAQTRQRVGFWVVAAALITLMFAASAPSPLYVVYQARWGFSTPMLTVVFAVYVVALLAALLTVGRLSDYLGRRPLLVVSLALEVVAMFAFLGAHGVGGLLLARVVQGLATGTATGTISATLVDLLPPGRARLGALVNSAAPLSGLAAGALASGLIVQYVPSPTTVVFAVLAAAFALLVALVVGLPETIQRRPGALAALLPRLGVPRAARTQFVIATPILMATWAMGGLYLSLGASLTAGVFGIHSHVVAGLAVTVLAAAGALAGVWGSDRDAARVMTAGAFLLIAGNAVTLLALFTTSTPVFFAGAAVSGLGFGSGFLGAFRSLVALAEPGERAGLFGAIYTVSYIGFSVLAVIAGLLTPEFGLKQTAIGYGITVIVLTLAAVLPRVIRSRSGQLEIEELAEEIDAAERPTLATACPTAVATTE